MSGPAFSRVHGAFHSLDGRSIRPGQKTKCPAHDDRDPSLVVLVNDLGAYLKCHAGCESEEVAAALGLKTEMLFDNYDPDWPAKVAEKSARRDAEVLAKHAGEKQQSNEATKEQSTPVQDRGEGRRTREDSKPVEKRREHEVEALLRLYDEGELDDDLALAEAAGLLPSFPPLPDGASPLMRKVAGLAETIVRIQVAEDVPNPLEVWFAYRWVAERLRRPPETVYRAWRRLREVGWLELRYEAEKRPDQQRGTFVFTVAGLLPEVEQSEPAGAVLPAEPGRVEADDAGRVDHRQEVAEDAAVGEAVADDGREVLERDDGLRAAVAQAAGRHGVEYYSPFGVSPLVVFDEDRFSRRRTIALHTPATTAATRTQTSIQTKEQRPCVTPSTTASTTPKDARTTVQMT